MDIWGALLIIIILIAIGFGVYLYYYGDKVCDRTFLKYTSPLCFGHDIKKALVCDPACGDGEFCLDAKCFPSRPLGSVCVLTSPKSCASGKCVLGGAGKAYCAPLDPQKGPKGRHVLPVPGELGVSPSAPVAKGCSVALPCPTGYVCKGIPGVCVPEKDLCKKDGDCGSGKYCMALTGVCMPQKEIGASAARKAQCKSGVIKAGKCFPATLVCKKDVDCSSDRYCAMIGKVCLPKKKAGEHSARKGQCLSGNRKGGKCT